MKILLLDIETAPKVALVWKFWDENISPKQVLDHGHIMSYAAKWYMTNEIYYEENRKDDEKELIKNLVNLLDEADITITHNGNKFDLKQIRARAVVNGINPPSPFISIDTCSVARKEFGFPSNSLEYLTEVMGCKIKKGNHKKFPGFELWLECLRNNEQAWEELRFYNIQDVLALEQLYEKMKPWISNHPHISLDDYNTITKCPKCGSEHIQWRGYSHTRSYTYKRFQCLNCKGWSRSRYNENKRNESILTSI